MISQIKHLENTLKTFMAVEEMEFMPILNAFGDVINADENVYIYLLKDERNRQTIFSFRDENGNMLVPSFLSVRSAKAFEDQFRNSKTIRWSLGLMNFQALSEYVINNSAFNGIIIDPNIISFIATPTLLEDAVNIQPSSHVTLIYGDILELSAEAMVCPTDTCFSGKGTIEKAVRRVVKDEDVPCEDLRIGDVLVAENTGEGRVVLDYDYIYYVVSPDAKNAHKLGTCYTTILDCAKRASVKSIIFPCIGTGRCKIDKDYAVKISLLSVLTWMNNNQDYDIDVYFCSRDSSGMMLYQTCIDSMIDE